VSVAARGGGRGRVASARHDRELRRYILPDEHVVAVERQHWISQFWPILGMVLATILAFTVDVNAPETPSGQMLASAMWLTWLVMTGYFAWRIASWRHDFFVVTARRLLYFEGFIHRRASMLLMTKVTDLRFDRSLMGRLLGYGSFHIESAGQEQALSTVEHVPNAEQLYQAICRQLFNLAPHAGEDRWDGDDRLDDDPDPQGGPDDRDPDDDTRSPRPGSGDPYAGPAPEGGPGTGYAADPPSRSPSSRGRRDGGGDGRAGGRGSGIPGGRSATPDRHRPWEQVYRSEDLERDIDDTDELPVIVARPARPARPAHPARPYHRPHQP